MPATLRSAFSIKINKNITVMDSLNMIDKLTKKSVTLFVSPLTEFIVIEGFWLTWKSYGNDKYVWKVFFC